MKGNPNMDRGDDALKAIREALIAKDPIGIPLEIGESIAAALLWLPVSLRKHCRIIFRREGEILRGNDQEAGCIYRLIKGDASLQREFMGEAITLHRLEPGDWLLESQLLIRPQYT